jgi:hypothetical protein
MSLGPLRRLSAGLLRRQSAGLLRRQSAGLLRRQGVPLLVGASLLVAGLGITDGPWPRPFADDHATVTAVPENGRLGGDIPDGIPDPRLDQPEVTGAHPVSYPVGTSAVRSAVARELPGPDTADLALPARVLQAYRSAAASLGRSDAGCHLSWPLLAGIGKVESGHAYGGAVDRHGDTLEPILGPVLDGGPGVAAIPDTDDGRWDTDDTWDRAVGPMQFIPSSWAIHGADGNHDGRRDPNNVVDAALASGGYLCTGERDVEVEKDRRAAVFSYNHSWDYVDLVLDWAKRYVGGDFKVVQANGVNCEDNELPANIGDLVEQIIQFALAQRGKPYVFGANGPDAWDCSSLLQAAYRSVGLAIPRTTFEQWPFGVKIDKGEEQPGDLVFFNSGPGTSANNPGHVGMVIGGGKMIVASCSACVPAIGVKPYKRSNWVGTTRPLAREDFKQRVSQLAAQ